MTYVTCTSSSLPLLTPTTFPRASRRGPEQQKVSSTVHIYSGSISHSQTETHLNRHQIALKPPANRSQIDKESILHQ
jgi:hypothetical protein